VSLTIVLAAYLWRKVSHPCSSPMNPAASCRTLGLAVLNGIIDLFLAGIIIWLLPLRRCGRSASSSVSTSSSEARPLIGMASRADA